MMLDKIDDYEDYFINLINIDDIELQDKAKEYFNKMIFTDDLSYLDEIYNEVLFGPFADIDNSNNKLDQIRDFFYTLYIIEKNRITLSNVKYAA